MLIPTERLTNWEVGVTVGVPGGFEQYLPGGANERLNSINVTQAPYNADNTGATDASTEIQAAIDAATAGDVVYLPAGTYRLDALISLDHNDDEITIRGDGDTTILAPNGTVGAIYMGRSNGWGNPHEPITGGLTQGSTVLTLASTTEFSANQTIKILFEDETDNTAIAGGAVPVIHVSGYKEVRSQITRIVSKTATTLTISPGIYCSPRSGLGAWVDYQSTETHLSGIENLKIDATNTTGQTSIYCEQLYGCWFYNVTSVQATNRHLHLQRSLFCELRRCNFSGTKESGPNHALLLMDDACATLVEDNIFEDGFPNVEVNFGSCGNVFAYNLFENAPVGGSVLFTMDSNHGPHTDYSLWEGNVSPNFVADGYYGSCSEDTIFRNWLHGTYQGDDVTTFTVALKRFTRNYSFAGNILGKTGVASGGFSYGQPNIGNGDSTGTAEPTTSDFWGDWKATATLTTRTSDTAGTITVSGGTIAEGQQIHIWWNNRGNIHTLTASTVVGSAVSWTGGSGSTLPAQGTSLEVFMGPSGYQELDLDVENSTIDKGNYTYGASGAAGSMSSLGGDTLPDSFFRDAKPSYFASLGWPPFNPVSPNSAGYADIPAGYRFLNNGDDPPAEGSGGTTITVANVTNFNIL